MPALTKNLTGKVQKWFKNGLKKSNEKSKGESTDVEDKEVSQIDDSSLCDDSVITGNKAVNLIEDPTKGIEERSPSLNGSKMSNEKSNLKSADVEDEEVTKINDNGPCDDSVVTRKKAVNVIEDTAKGKEESPSFLNGSEMSNEKSKGESTDVEDKEVSQIDDSGPCDDSVVTGNKAVNLIVDTTKDKEERSPPLNGSKVSNEKSKGESTDVEDKEVSKINDNGPCDDSVVAGNKAVNVVVDTTKDKEERSPPLNGSKKSKKKSKGESTDVEDKEVSKINDSSPCDRKSPLSTLLFVLVISILGYFCYSNQKTIRVSLLKHIPGLNTEAHQKLDAISEPESDLHAQKCDWYGDWNSVTNEYECISSQLQ